MSEKVLNSNEDKAKLLAEIQRKRKEKHAGFDDAAKAQRLDSELKLGEIEATTGKTLGIDLAVVFLPNGKMIVIHKPAAVVHNKLMLAQANNTVTENVVTEYVTAVVEWPSMIETEKLFFDYANARDAVVNAGVQLAGVDQSNMLGK